MIPDLRRPFNAAWTEARYQSFLETLVARVGVPVEFPLSETPCFFPSPLIDELAATGEELIRQAMTGDAGAAAAQIVPDRFRGPGAGDKPTFLQVDFGLTRDESGGIVPKLVELQAFPSLSPWDVQATLAELTATAIAADVQRHAPRLPKLVVCGGGALNGHLMRRLQALLPGTGVLSSEEEGLPPLQVEAAAFAWLARQCVRREKLALTSTTGARGARVLGAVWPA